ncbi:MAG: glycosyltransferase family 2 protein, partial [Thermodesulfobacteriota bacterium]
VEDNTLLELIKAMEEDDKIGIAGSRVVDAEKKDITVEAGAFFRLDTIGVKPLFRNKKNIDIMTTIEDVDYVAICSALVRVSALKEVGLMDQRFFIFWDDMDWGLQFKKNGYRVVAILNSIAYHLAFTEKRSALMDFYYGNRNSLLTYAKDFAYLRRAIIFYSFLRYKCKVLTFLGLNGRRDVMKLGFESIFDFIRGRWGKKDLRNISKDEESKSCNFPEKTSKVLILNGGNTNEIYDALGILKKLFPNAAYTLLMTDDRLDMFNFRFDQIVQINTKSQYNLSYLLFIFFKVLSNKYDVAVNFKYASPFSYAVNRAYTFDPSKKQFREDKSNLNNIWKLILSTALGEVIAMLLFPIVYALSFKHGKA